MNNRGKILLLIGASLNFLIALLHVGIAIIGPSAYLYYGATDLARLAAQGSFVPVIVTLILAVVFAAFAGYALAGAGLLQPPPLLRIGLLFIGCVYVLRGLIIVLDVIRLIYGAGYPFRQTVFSAVALIIGLLYLVGTSQRWHDLIPKSKVS